MEFNKFLQGEQEEPNFSDLSFKDKYKNVFEKLKNNIELFCAYIDDISNPELYEDNNIDFIKTDPS